MNIQTYKPPAHKPGEPHYPLLVDGWKPGVDDKPPFDGGSGWLDDKPHCP